MPDALVHPDLHVYELTKASLLVQIARRLQPLARELTRCLVLRASRQNDGGQLAGLRFVLPRAHSMNGLLHVIQVEVARHDQREQVGPRQSS
eukprot:CAMPEP_0115359826 /NCGR_PEP_ID=MMETSP0270-20121206/101369_1 /TAXON_ID=71861 /ORGANISM="Scrippsiella trochoidea, Strain CCMP3099" /LENGTH=91 /DNA_ID=CAMNT_0002782337 /DNA_START=148 /DNA_END=423 /DNA_ORIENTATION=+